MKLLAYNGDPKIKETYLARVEAHRKADQIIKGTYGRGDWNNGGKGCAVGCTVHSDEHIAYEKELGIPRILAHLEDRIFEGASNDWAVRWPGRFLAVIPVGADLSNIWTQFAFWLLVDAHDGVVKYARTEKSITAIRAVAEAYKNGLKDKAKWQELCIDAAAPYAYASAAYAKSKAFERQGEKLLELLKQAPVPKEEQ
jgi:hypothetical protein